MPEAPAWEARYQSADTPWDLQQPAPPFVSVLATKPAPLPGRVLVLGCGRGYDARLWAAHGHQVTAVDFAPSAIAAAQKLDPLGQVNWLVSDMFDLLPRYAGQFDYVVEHTCFCALERSQRPAYAQLVHQLLAPRGELIALFWAHPRSGGPPYGCSVAELHTLFEPLFETKSLVLATDAIAKRRGEEYLARWPKRA